MFHIYVLLLQRLYIYGIVLLSLKWLLVHITNWKPIIPYRSVKWIVISSRCKKRSIKLEAGCPSIPNFREADLGGDAPQRPDCRITIHVDDFQKAMACRTDARFARGCSGRFGENGRPWIYLTPRFPRSPRTPTIFTSKVIGCCYSRVGCEK